MLSLIYNFSISECIGSGQFGVVKKGVWTSLDGPKDVAVKTLNDETTEEDKVKLLQEAAINGQFHHRSIISLHGVVTIGNEASRYRITIIIVLHEFCRL